jgi:predicted RNase H-like HicB family nuclease
MTPHYHINIFWHEPDHCWIADVPDLEGCSAHGDNPEEAAREGRIAIDEWITSAREHGDVIPKPRYRPAIYAMRSAA